MNDETKRGDGGTEPVNESLTQRFKASIEGICGSAQYTGWRRRKMAEDTRLCRWDGMSPDGRKRQEHLGEKPFPFEGASDGRVRTVDTVVNFLVAVLVNAAYRAQPRFSGMESSDYSWANKMTTLLRYMLRNHLGSSLRKELIRLAQYMLADSPGAAVLQVYWDRQVVLESREITMKDLAQQLFDAMGGRVTQADLIDLADTIQNPERQDEAVAMIRAMIPQITVKRANRVVRELREDGSGEFPFPVVAKNGPKPCALRLFEDVFFNADTLDDIQRAPEVMIPEWLSAEEVKAKETDEGWSPEFIDAILEHRGKDAFEGMYKNEQVEDVEGDYSEASYDRMADRHKDQVQVIHVMYKEVNEDGVMGLYKVTFHPAVDDLAARDREILDTPGGQYPLFYFPREVLTRRILDTRGLPETMMSHQLALKQLFDSVGDHVALTTLPPLKVPRKRPDLSLVIGPLAKIKEDRPGEIDYMRGPEYPRAADAHREEIRRQIGEYTGVPVSESASGVANTLLQFAVDGFLDVWGEAVMFMLKLGQEYWSDQDIMRIVGGKQAFQVVRSKQELAGQYDLVMTMDVRDMDTAFLMEKVKVIKEMILPIDTLATVDRARLTQRIMEWVDPVLAEDVIQPMEAAQQREVEDEHQNLIKIQAGIEPQMITEGQNFPLRLQVIQNVVSRNPEFVEKMSPNSKLIMQQWMKYRQQMVVQMENAMIGRTGAASALG